MFKWNRKRDGNDLTKVDLRFGKSGDVFYRYLMAKQLIMVLRLYAYVRGSVVPCPVVRVWHHCTSLSANRYDKRNTLAVIACTGICPLEMGLSRTVALS